MHISESVLTSDLRRGIAESDNHLDDRIRVAGSNVGGTETGGSDAVLRFTSHRPQRSVAMKQVT